jgi:histidyl-tRNA synthetase
MSNKLKAQKLAGFRDFFSEDIKIREFVINTFKQVFEKYGYEPLATPALEYAEIFAGEAGSEAEKLFYRFKDQGGRDIMLKYEVMISMCRAVAENINTITFPYKRYQIQNVWRAEKPQKGRYREFTQCDADTIDSASVITDAEFIQMGIEVMQKLGFKNFVANISNRKFLNGLIKFAGAKNNDFIPICLSIDKLPKIGKDKVKQELVSTKKISSKVADKVLAIVTTTGKSDQLIKQFKAQLKSIPEAMEGLEELETIFSYLKTVNLDPQFYQFSPFIARGLAYYTGPVWEFEVLEGGIGSVAGCGRYDNTIGNLIGSGKQIPATGGSFGIERLVEVIKDKKMIKIDTSPVKVLVTWFDDQTFNQSLISANALRDNNISTMLYPKLASLNQQLKYADNKNIPFALIIGGDEVKENQVTLKDLKTREQQTFTLEKAIDKLK